MAEVVVTFRYNPAEPDEQDSTGMSEREYNRLSDYLGVVGAFDIEFMVEDSETVPKTVTVGTAGEQSAVPIPKEGEQN